jgi:hypothetical protein
MKLTGFLNGLVRTRPGRIFALLVVFFSLATIVLPGPGRLPSGPAVSRVTVARVPLDEDQPGRRRVGELVFLRGWALTSDEPRFGAISAMHIENGRATALSDAGTLLEFPLPTRPGALPLRIRPLYLGMGVPKRSRDTESLLVHGDEAWIGFEAVNAVKRFRRTGWREESAARPTAMQNWRANSGAEAMVRLRDGRFLVFAEGSADDSAFSPVLLFEGDPARPGTRATVLRYRHPAGFRVTDAALLPDGRLLILHRRVRLTEGFSASLALAEIPELRPGATFIGREIAALRSPLTVDNMEALSVAREGGRTIVRIASDDNFMPIQRTLLLEFALLERGSRR